MGYRPRFLALALLLFLVDLVAVLAGEDYYKELGISNDASAKTIKRAFRKLSLKYHPDKNKNDETAAAKFLSINKAYEVLSDEEKRQVYDLHGEEGLNKQKQPASPFDAFFGGGGGGGRRKGPDFTMELPVTLEELYNGGEKSFNIKRNVLCKKCRGTGAKGGEVKKCRTCKGQGVVMKLQQLGPGFNVQMQAACDKCGGKGSIAKHKCPACKGNKIMMEEKLLEAVIEKGMPDAHQIVFERASEQSPDTIPGNVVLTLQTQKHHRFERRGNHLYHDMKITLKEALLGFKKNLVHLDRRKVKVKQDGVTPPDFVKVLKNEGMPHHNYPSDRGNLYVRFLVEFPKSFTKSQMKDLEKLLQ
jgi:DnaJ-related protein SCJ1